MNEIYLQSELIVKICMGDGINCPNIIVVFHSFIIELEAIIN